MALRSRKITGCLIAVLQRAETGEFLGGAAIALRAGFAETDYVLTEFR
jgi:hypothetical protein